MINQAEDRIKLTDIRDKYGLKNNQIAAIIGVSTASINITTCKSHSEERSHRYASMLEAHVTGMVEYFHENWVHLNNYDIRGMAIVIIGTHPVYKIPQNVRRVARIIEGMK